jgi:hypothetical protein
MNLVDMLVGSVEFVEFGFWSLKRHPHHTHRYAAAVNSRIAQIVSVQQKPEIGCVKFGKKGCVCCASERQSFLKQEHLIAKPLVHIFDSRCLGWVVFDWFSVIHLNYPPLRKEPNDLHEYDGARVVPEVASTHQCWCCTQHTYAETLFFVLFFLGRVVGVTISFWHGMHM